MDELGQQIPNFISDISKNCGNIYISAHLLLPFMAILLPAFHYFLAFFSRLYIVKV